MSVLDDGPTDVQVSIFLGVTALRVGVITERPGGPGPDGFSPFVSIELCPTVAISCGDPDRLDQLAAAVAEAAAALRALESPTPVAGPPRSLRVAGLGGAG